MQRRPPRRSGGPGKGGARAGAAAFVAVLSACLGLLPATPADADITLASKTPRIVAKVGPYDDRRRSRIHTALNAEYLRLWEMGLRTPVARAKTKTFKGYPYLNVEDRNRDGTADFYSYTPKAAGGHTLEFGAFFDLAGDGTPDWIVFNGGSALGEGGAFKIVYWSHHAIDRNNDGRFDTLVVDCVDLDGNGRIDPGVSAWFYDANFDGKFDAAEHIVKGKVTRIAVKNRRIDAKTAMKTFQEIRIGSPFGTLFDEIARDIRAAR
ncbi:hypothetical protein [Ovoidimarina sediminis]|uniref:hypothetical protein n=1 Tax=Ovoidimarina sediminis TaxID=3079856 RepID=UPI00290AC20A|nr:hypothetical protein [Rhodophyticola sp. MJ-SS7]MDU8943388.1 hypothetical protein [Rhodophyticola sp. MJ-SS7]